MYYNLSAKPYREISRFAEHHCAIVLMVGMPLNWSHIFIASNHRARIGDDYGGWKLGSWSWIPKYWLNYANSWYGFMDWSWWSNMNTLERLLRTKLSYTAKEIKGLAAHCQICPLLEEYFKVSSSIESAVVFDLGMQSSKFDDLVLASKQWS